MRRLLLSIDVSTTTLGIAIFDVDTKEVLKLTQLTPKVKNIKNKVEEHFKKADLFKDFIQEFKGIGIMDIVIETPLLGSNNIYTVATLLKFNGIISKICYDELGVVPDYISTNDSRRIAFPDLVAPRLGKNNKYGKPVLFGAYPKDVNKKEIIWEKVRTMLPNMEWPKNPKTGELTKQCWDISDAVCVGIARLRMKYND